MSTNSNSCSGICAVEGRANREPSRIRDLRHRRAIVSVIILKMPRGAPCRRLRSLGHWLVSTLVAACRWWCCWQPGAGHVKAHYAACWD